MGGYFHASMLPVEIEQHDTPESKSSHPGLPHVVVGSGVEISPAAAYCTGLGFLNLSVYSCSNTISKIHILPFLAASVIFQAEPFES